MRGSSIIRLKTCCSQLGETRRMRMLSQQRKQERAKRVSFLTKAMMYRIRCWILGWQGKQKNKAMLQLDDMRVEVSRREQEIMQMATKMKTLEEQHQDYQKHIAVLKESLCAKEEHYTMLQTDVSSAHHMANRKVKEGGLKAPESAAAPHRKQRCWYSCFTMLSNISGNSSQICNPFLFKQGNYCFPSCFAGQLRRGKEVRTSDSFGCVRFVGH